KVKGRGTNGFAGAAESFRTQPGLAGARGGAREGALGVGAKRHQGGPSPEARSRPRDEVSSERQGTEALSGCLQAEPRSARGARGGPLHLLGPRQDRDGA